jgi:heme-degrading monooxygenase HmoA
MILVLFRSKLVHPSSGYPEMADEMEQLARTMPGFVDVKAYKAEDGERLTVVFWQDEQTLRAWREQARHRVAQRMGREQWYQYYKMDVATIVRSTEFNRELEGVGGERS